MRGRAGKSMFGRATSVVLSYGLASTYLAWVLSRHFYEPAYVTMSILVTMYLACYTVISSYSMILLDPEERRILLLFPISDRTLFLSRVANLLFFALLLGAPFVLPLALFYFAHSVSAARGALFFMVLLLCSLWTTGASLLLYNTLIRRFASSTRLLAVVQSVLVFILLFFYQGLPAFSTANAWWNSFNATRFGVFFPTHWFIGIFGLVSGRPIIPEPGIMTGMAVAGMAILVVLLNTRWMLLPDLNAAANKEDAETQDGSSVRFPLPIHLLLHRPAALAGYQLFTQLMARDRGLRFQMIPIIMMPVAVAVYGFITGGLHTPFPYGLLIPAAKLHIPVIVFFLFSARHTDQTVLKAVQASSVWILRFQTQDTLHQYARGVRTALQLRVLLPQAFAVFFVFAWAMPLQDAAAQVLFLYVAARFQTAVLNALKPKIPFFEIESQLETAQRFAQFLIIIPFVLVVILAHSFAAGNERAFVIMLLLLEALLQVARLLWRLRPYRFSVAEESR
jgi:hypothetical protein